jgi:hypothetical protein
MKKKQILPTIGKKDQKRPMSKGQKEFNRRIKKVNKLKDELQEMETFIPEIRSRYQAKIVPLQDKIANAREKFVKMLDRSYALKFFRSKEKEKIQDLILNHAHELIHSYGKTELIPIYDKYNEVSFEEEKEQMKSASKGMAEDLFKNFFGMDVDLDNVDMDNFEEIGDRFKEQMEAKAAEEEQQRKKRKKTKAQQAKEERQTKEAKSISKTARELYMKLVKEFHPDRETDEQKQAEMTKKMQHITEAYKNKDLYELLRLEMELLQGIEERLDELSEQQLKLYNKLLKEQQQELEGKLYSLKFMPAMEPFAEYIRFGKYGMQVLDRDHAELKKKLHFIEDDTSLLSDKQYLRDFLRDYEIEEEDEMDFFFPFDDFEEEEED